MATEKQRSAAHRNVKKAASAARRRKSIEEDPHRAGQIRCIRSGAEAVGRLSPEVSPGALQRGAAAKHRRLVQDGPRRAGQGARPESLIQLGGP
jgi:hypothetical protein